MRKISELAGKAFRHSKNFSRDNTNVITEGGITRMYLHGHMIAKRIHAEHGLSAVCVTLAGWGTPTTRERVNGLLQMLGSNAGYYQKNHEQHFADENGDFVHDSSTWYETATRC